MEQRGFDLGRLPRSIHLGFDGDQAVFTYIDQRLLPGELMMESTSDYRRVIDAIKTLAVRGAPAIGVAGAAALALWCQGQDAGERVDNAFWTRLRATAEEISTARPTAVNLSWAVSRAIEELQPQLGPDDDVGAATRVLCEIVAAMEEQDEAANRAIGAAGAELLKPGSRVLTHCNAGSLATCFFGTALGVVYAAAEQGKIERVYADETRPVGQGARLTAWELSRAGVPVTLICDNMAASVMAQGKVDAVIVGADRIARNGDVANKIGTYGVAVLAHEHGVPFYVAAPTSTIDLDTPTGADIVIEQRPASEVLPQPLEGVDVYNPAFDVTPSRLVTGIITENGVTSPAELL